MYTHRTVRRFAIAAVIAGVGVTPVLAPAAASAKVPHGGPQPARMMAQKTF